jgi:MFS family permease
LTIAVAALVVAIVQGHDWGWAGARVLGSLALAVLTLGVLARRIVSHPAPIVEPAILRVRSFSLATLGSLLFFTAFSAMLLASVLFLTGVWHQRILTAGMMIFPGPAVAAATAIPAARLGRRLGPGRVGALGTLLFALGGVLWITSIGAQVHYASAFLPGMLIGGAGVGFVIPSLTGAVAATLPPARLATGIAVQTTGRQVGSALGFAILIAILGSTDSVADFRQAWWFMLLTSLFSGAVLVSVGPAASSAAEPERLPRSGEIAA